MIALPRQLRPSLRIAVWLCLALPAIHCGGETAPVPTERSVVLVTLDTTRADRVGAFGGTAVPTPNLDRAAAEGVRFLQAISPVPLTLPAHTSMFTGLYPFRHGVRHNGAFRVPPAAITLAERLRDAGFRTGAFVGAFVLDRSFGLDQGFEIYSGVVAKEISPDFLRPSDLQRPAAAVNEAALRWIDTQHGGPFFAWIHYYDPHEPYAPPEDPSLDLRGTGYDREISYVDHCFGALREHLERAGLLERTILVVAGDHGESLGSHGEQTHGVFLYEPAVRVPLFVRAPHLVRAGATYESPVSLVDLAPTILSLLGLAPLEATDGTPLCSRSGRLVPERADRLVFGETLMPRIELGWSELSMARDGRYKYIRAPRPELYDLSQDPRESKNLLDSDPDAATDLAEALALELARPGSLDDGETANVLSQEELAKLRSLGYLRGAGRSAGGAPGGSLPDPKDRIAEARRLDEAEEALERGDLAAAKAKYEEVLTEGPGNHAALQGRARSLLREGDLARAEEAALAALAAAGADPQSPPALADNARALLASILSLDGRHREAENSLRPSASADGKPAAPRSPAGLLMAGAKNLDDAVAIVRIAVQRRPNDPWTWSAALELSRRTGDRTGVERTRGRLVALGAASAAALVESGTRAQDDGDLSLAISLFESALDVAPRHPDVLGYLATARLAAGDLAGAETALREAGRLRPEDPRVPMYLANIALLRDQEDAARAFIDEALRKAPQFVPPLLEYARWLQRKGRTAEAIRVTQSALERRPEDSNAKALLGELRALPAVQGG